MPRLWMLLPLMGLVGCAAERDAPKKEAPAPAVERSAEVRRLTGKIRLDGVIDETAWDAAVPLKNFAVFWQKAPAHSKTTARLLWDDRYLYFSAEMEDEDLFALTKDRNGMTWLDDVFELFFKPAGGQAYYEFQVNALNTQLELFLPSRGAGGYRRFAPLTRLGMESAVRLRGSLNRHTDRDRGWSVEGRLPWTAFKATGGRPRPGDRWKFALCRYDYSAYLGDPDLSSTAPLTVPDFHHHEDYGDLLFVGERE